MHRQALCNKGTIMIMVMIMIMTMTLIMIIIMIMMNYVRHTSTPNGRHIVYQYVLQMHILSVHVSIWMSLWFTDLRRKIISCSSTDHA